MSVHIVYRSHGGENTKDRPAYYSKLIALASCARAAEAAGVDITFINDGPIPVERLSLMRQVGTVIGTPVSRGMRSSYRAALNYALRQEWPDTDVVFFSEDDYLYTEDAFLRLGRFEQLRPDTTYFALFGFSGTPGNVAAGKAEHALPKNWEPVRAVEHGDEWLQIDSTASTFGARLGALRKDFGIFMFCMVPHANSLRDHDTMMLLQGYEPHRTSVLLRDLFLLAPGGITTRLRAAALAPFLIASNIRAHRFRRNRRILFAADPNVAAHLEVQLIPEGHDWASEAAHAVGWLDEFSPAPQSRWPSESHS
jgi:hypothetical protein